MKRSGASSWEEFTGIWNPTEEAAIDCIKRLRERLELLPKLEGTNRKLRWTLERAVEEMPHHPQCAITCPDTNDNCRCWKGQALAVIREGK